MHQGGGPDETRWLGGPYGTRRIEGTGGPDPTHRMDGSDSPVIGGRYRLEGFLGGGGMAEVHRATDLRLNRPVAVKIFRPGADPDGERRFQEEAQVLANLNHPGLVAVHDSGVDQRRPYLVMELVDGYTLREVLNQERMPLEEVARIGTALADVLAHVHEQGVIHRDVKPSNILLGRDGRPRLADFGISRLTGATSRTAAGGALGTASYMAPEQVEGAPVGPPADVYALGLVLLEAVTGLVEYPGQGWQAAAARLSTPPAVPEDVPDPLHRALLAMTETDPRRRPTAFQAAEMLAGSGPHEPAEYWVGDRPPRRSRTGRNLLLALGLFALVAIATALAFAVGDEESGTATPGAPPTAEQPANDVPAAEDPAGEQPPAENPAGDEPGSQESGDSPGLPGLPSFDPPDLPDVSDLPDAPELPESVREDAANAWEEFTDWVSDLF